MSIADDLKFWNDIKKNQKRTKGRYLVPPETVIHVKGYLMWIRHNFAQNFGEECYSLSVDELIKKFSSKFKESGFEWKMEPKVGLEYFKLNGTKVSQFNKVTEEIKEWHSSKEESYRALLLLTNGKYKNEDVLDNYRYNGHYSQGRYEYENEWTRDFIIVNETGELLSGELELF
ncbi:UNVERIFIED_CONTAM: hypothetical protein ABIC26_002707 [Paenibacillus sp. PvR008]